MVGERAEAPDVAEQHGDLLLPPRRRLAAADRQRALGAGGEQRHDGQVMHRAELAGEPDVRPGIDAHQRQFLDRTRQGLALHPLRHADAAGRAAAAAAAHRIMRHAADAAGLQHAVPLGQAHLLAARVANLDEAALCLAAAQRAQGKQAEDQRGKHGIGDVHQHVDGFERAGDQRLVDALGQRLLLHQGDQLAGMGEGKQRDDRHQHRGDKQPGGRGRVPAAVAQPEMQPEAAMHPDDHDRDGLGQPDAGIGDPQHADDELVCVGHRGQFVEDAGAHDMLGEQQRDGEARRHLRRLAQRHDQAAPAVEAAQHQRDVHQHRPVEQDRPDGIAPDGEEPQPAGLRRLERDQVERQIAEMHDDERHHHQPGSQPGVAQHPLRQPGMRRGRRLLRRGLQGCHLWTIHAARLAGAGLRHNARRDGCLLTVRHRAPAAAIHPLRSPVPILCTRVRALEGAAFMLRCSIE